MTSRWQQAWHPVVRMGKVMAPDSQAALTLLQVIALVCAMACLSWGLMAGPGRMERPSTLSFLLSNLLLVGSVFLTLGRTDVLSPLDYWRSYWLADMFGLTAIALFRHGIEHLLRQPRSVRASFAVIVVAGAGMAALYPEPLIRARGTLFSVAAGWLALQIFRQCVSGLRQAYGPWQAAAAGSVFAAISLTMFTRAAVLVFWPARGLAMEATSVGASTSILWASLIQILLVNFCLSALLLLSLMARIRHLALHDELTGCLNRRAIQQRIDEECQRWGRHARTTAPPGTGTASSVVMFDLDHFKRINDEHGHAAGDSALQHVTQVVRGELRKIDALGRWGGEEFLLLLPLTDARQALEAATRVRHVLASSTWQWRNQAIPLTASFAVASLHGGRLDFEALDQALYHAKQNGRNCVVIATPTP